MNAGAQLLKSGAAGFACGKEGGAGTKLVPAAGVIEEKCGGG